MIWNIRRIIPPGKATCAIRKELESCIFSVTEAVVKEKMEQLATELTKSIEERILKINSSMEESVQRYLSQVNSKQTDCRVNVEEEISALRSTVAGLVGCAEQSRQCEQMRLELQSTLGQVNSTVEQNSSLIEKIESRLESHRSQLKDNIERIDASVEQLVDQLRTKSNTTQVQELIETNRNQWLKKLESLQEKLESVDEKILGLEVQKSESKVEKPATTLATKSDDIQGKILGDLGIKLSVNFRIRVVRVVQSEEGNF